MCSAMRSIFNLYSTFNALFYIQLRIQHSTIHFIFNSLFTHSIIYSTISTIYSTFNLIQLFIQLFCALTTSGQWHRSLLVKNMAAMAAAAPSGSQNAGYGNRSLWRWHKAPLRCGVWLSKVSSSWLNGGTRTVLNIWFIYILFYWTNWDSREFLYIWLIYALFEFDLGNPA